MWFRHCLEEQAFPANGLDKNTRLWYTDLLVAVLQGKWLEFLSPRKRQKDPTKTCLSNSGQPLLNCPWPRGPWMSMEVVGVAHGMVRAEPALIRTCMPLRTQCGGWATLDWPRQTSRHQTSWKMTTTFYLLYRDFDEVPIHFALKPHEKRPRHTTFCIVYVWRSTYSSRPKTSKMIWPSHF